MLFSRIRILALAVVIFLCACQPEIQTAPPLPTVSIWQVQYTPATAWLAPYFQYCAASQPGVNLVVSEHPAQALAVQTADFSFEWGERTDPPGFAAVIGQDRLAVVVNPSNSLTSLVKSEIQGLFSGKISDWGPLVLAKCPTCGTDFKGEVKAYVYAPGSEMQLAAAWITPGPETILAPTPADVIKAVASEPDSIGFVPARWLDASVKQLKVEDAATGLLERPVLAMAPAEPQGAKRTWLACLQDQIR